MLEACDAAGVALVPLVAPTTPDERLARDRRARARLPLHGVGHGHDRRARPLSAHVRRARGARPAHTDVPVALGLRDRARPSRRAGRRRAGADGVIVGSRLVRAAAEADDPPAAVHALVGAFAEASRG